MTTGKKFAGFIDESGNRVRRFQDESGNALDQGMGWASHRWNDLGRQAQGLADAAAQMGDNLDLRRPRSRRVGGQHRARSRPASSAAQIS